MIFNRTQFDVDNAEKIRVTKVKTFSPLSDSEIETLEKGFLTINTLNRIEDKQTELKQLFNGLGYWSIDITNKSWKLGDNFTSKGKGNDFQRIIDNENTLRNAFFVYSYTPSTPNISFGFEDINSIEKILYDLDVMINDVKSNYLICGTFECGE